jgi:hypothetical protein
VTRPRLARLAPLFLLSACVLLAVWKLTLGGRIIARGDLFLYFYPLRDYAAEALRAGRLPLWNPYTFMGAPFLANSQSGFFYPLNMALAWLPVAQAVSLSIALHLLIATLGAYALARRGFALDRVAALCTALLFGLGGYLGAQIEHLNQLQVLAWLPLCVLCVPGVQSKAMDRAKSDIPPLRMLALSALLALQITAGHTQSLYIACIVTGIAALIECATIMSGRNRTSSPQSGGDVRFRPAQSLRTQLAQRELRAALAPVLLVAVAAALAALISAAQLLPTLELSRESYRSGGLPFNEAGAFSWRPWVIARALLPTYGDPLFAEYVAYLGAGGIALCALGALAPGKPRKAKILALVLCVAGFVLALGIVTPVFNVLYRVLPGFNLFRAPARWLICFALGAALLAGLGVQALRNGVSRALALRWAALCALLYVGLAAGAWLGARISPEPEYAALPARPVLLGWAGAALLWLIAIAIYARSRISSSAANGDTPTRVEGQNRIYPRKAGVYAILPNQHRLAGALAALLLAAELLIAAQFQPYARAADAQALTSLRPATAFLRNALRNDPHARVLAISGLFFDPGDKTEQELIFAGSLNSDELYDRIIASKHKEILSPNLSLYQRIAGVDGYDGGLLPSKRFVQYTQQFAGADAKDGRLREFLKAVPERRWLEQMAVRYVVADKTQDIFIDGVFYDLLFTAAITGAHEFSLTPYDATALGLVFGLPDATPGERVASAELVYGDGTRQTFSLNVPDGAPPDGFVTQLRWPGARTPLSLRLTPADPARGLVLRGLTSIDARDGTFSSHVASADLLVRLVYSGDVKIYDIASNRSARAVLVNQPLLALPIQTPSAERVNITLPALTQPDTLLLRDSCYPGWVARVDGVETRINCVDTLFRSVALPTGARQIEFSYEPASVRIGLVLSVVGLLVWVGLAVWVWFGGRGKAFDKAPLQ